MSIRFNNIFYNDWEKVGELCWQRMPLYPKVSHGEIKLVAMIDFEIKPAKATPIWYPEFTGDIDFLQEIYDRSNNKILFKRNQEKIAMNHVDQFLFKIDRLKAFI